MSVPFVDLAAAWRAVAGDVEPKILALMAKGAYIGGPEVEGFEKEFATFCEAAACAGVDNGTSALRLILKALKIGPGDEVVVPANTFAATAEAVCHVGATPVFADVEEETLTLDPAAFEAALGPRTRAVMAVHLYGQSADMEAIQAIAAMRGVAVIEDAAQAHGARYKGRRAGTFGRAAGFSFYPAKNLGACGDGGAVVSEDRTLIETVKELRDHGQPKKHLHARVGETARLDAIQAAILRVKLGRLEEANARRRRVAKAYCERLASESAWLTLPRVAPDREPVWHLYVVHCDERDVLLAHLQAKGIGCGLHYPIPLNRQDAFRDVARVAGPLAVSERSAARLISLPMFPEMTEAQVDAVADALRAFARR